MKIFSRLEELDFLIRTKTTGTPYELAKKIKISERSMYGYIEQLKMMGAPIRYCRRRKTYYYKEEGRFVTGFSRIERVTYLIRFS